jgi:hypothetical protein
LETEPKRDFFEMAAEQVSDDDKNVRMSRWRKLRSAQKKAVATLNDILIDRDSATMPRSSCTNPLLSYYRNEPP